MDIRNGKCFDCGAEYQIPASFTHDVARCKECGKTVHIAKLGDPVPKPPAQAAAPSAAKPAAQKPKIKEHVPSGKTGSGPSMMERLRAERAAAANAETTGAPASKPKAAAKASAKARPARAGAGKSGAAKTSGTRRSSGGSSTRRRNTKDAGDEDKLSERGARKEKKSPVMAIAAVGLLVVAAVVFFMKDSLFGDADPVEAGDATTENVASNDDGSAATTDTNSDEGTSADDIGNGEPIFDDVDGAPDTDEGGSDEGGTAAADDEPDAPTDSKPVDSGPDTTALADIGPLFGTTPEQMAEMDELMMTWMDTYAGSAGNRARDTLTKEYGVIALPSIINGLKNQDLSTEEGASNGDNVQRALMDMFNGTNFGWKYLKQEPDLYLAFNRKVVVAWHTQIERIEADGIDYFITMAKMEMKKSRDSDEYAKPERAKLASELRAKYGDGTAAASDDAVDTGMDDLDLDVD
ncbi:MAG: hypothetical protein ACI8QS_000115 [Planctomycetota bacterium]|jgi:hypothetical protein